jgi:hypothetical protein
VNSADYEAFVASLGTCATVYRHKLDDDQVKFYWQALVDRPYADVERRMEKHARQGKFFPKPRDLRPIEPQSERIESNPERDARFDAADAESRRHWDQQIREHGDLARLRLAFTLWARYACEVDQSSTVLAAKRDWLRDRMGELLRAVPAREVLADFTLRLGVLQVFNAAGLHRLEQRAASGSLP